MELRFSLTMFPASNTLREHLLPIHVQEASFPIVGICFLFGAIFFEVIGTICMKLTAESELWRIGAYVSYALSFSLFPTVLKYIPLSIAYATWSGLGTMSVMLVSIFFFNEVLNLRQIVSISGIMVSVACLQQW